MSKPVGEYEVAPWHPHDPATLDGALIIGRARIELPSGEVLAGFEVITTTDERAAVYYDRRMLMFRLVPHG